MAARHCEIGFASATLRTFRTHISGISDIKVVTGYVKWTLEACVTADVTLREALRQAWEALEA